MKEIDNENSTKAKATKDNVYVIHTNKQIGHDPSKPTTTSMKEKGIVKYANVQTTIDRDRVLEKARTRNFCFKNVPQADCIGLQKCKINQSVRIQSALCEENSRGLKISIASKIANSCVIRITKLLYR